MKGKRNPYAKDVRKIRPKVVQDKRKKMLTEEMRKLLKRVQDMGWKQ